MNTKHLFLLLLAPLCCWGETSTATKPVIAMIDRQNGLSPTLLSVGTNSFTFSVEWSPDVKFPEEWLHIMGKLDAEQHWWDNLRTLNLNPANRADLVANGHWHDLDFPIEGGLTQGKATFEILYEDLPWSTSEKSKSRLAEKAFFSVVVPDPDDPGWLPSAEEREAIKKQEEEMMRKESEAKAEAPVDTGAADGSEEGGATASPLHRLWPYLAILPCALVLFYLMRRKQP